MKQQLFVANRAAEILEHLSMDQWRHVKGVENPTDIGTRGVSIEKLQVPTWLDEPSGLKRDKNRWPRLCCQENELETEKAITTVATETLAKHPFDWNCYCSFKRVKKLLAYCTRFKRKQQGPLEADEIHQVEQTLFRFNQTESFPNVFKSITSRKKS